VIFRLTRLVLYSLIISVCVSRAFAQSSVSDRPPHVDPSIERVVTGGRWKATSGSGQYRIIEIAQGGRKSGVASLSNGSRKPPTTLVFEGGVARDSRDR
jgi:hypothetical protein